MGGPSLTSHGDVVSSSLSFGGPKDAHEDLLMNFRLLRGQIQQVYAVDAPGNSPAGTNPLVTTYDVAVWRRDGSLEIIRRCQMLQPGFGGGFNNFLEALGPNPGPKATTRTIPPRDKPGQFVLVGLMEGEKYGGVILGCLPHTNPTAVATRPTQSEGTVMQGEFQGLNWLITNDGSLTVAFNGPRMDDGTPTDPSLGPTSISIDPKGNFQVATNNSQVVSVNRETQVVTVTNGPTSMVMDGKANKITQKAETVEQLGASTSRVQGGQVLISKTPDSTPAEPFVLGLVFQDFMTKVLKAISTHVHTGNLGVSVTPPLNASEFEQLAQSPIGDKKILSDFIVGEKG